MATPGRFFKWIGRSTVTRSKAGSQGLVLETGKVYETANFERHVVAEWVATGHAEYEGESKETNTVLKVQDGTMKIKTPKVGANL